MILGYLTVPGLDPYESALVGALMRGQRDEAGRFLAAVEAGVSPEARDRMARALKLETNFRRATSAERKRMSEEIERVRQRGSS